MCIFLKRETFFLRSRAEGAADAKREYGAGNRQGSLDRARAEGFQQTVSLSLSRCLCSFSPTSAYFFLSILQEREESVPRVLCRQPQPQPPPSLSRRPPPIKIFKENDNNTRRVRARRVANVVLFHRVVTGGFDDDDDGDDDGDANSGALSATTLADVSVSLFLPNNS